jgi:Fe-S cluster assembly protein SufB
MDYAPIGVNEDIVRLISEKNKEPEWMLGACKRSPAGSREPERATELPRHRLPGQYYWLRAL